MEYDLDVADIRWIRSHAKYGTRAEGKYAMRLDPSLFARMMNALEMASGSGEPVSAMQAEAVFVSEFSIMTRVGSTLGADIYRYWRDKRARVGKPLLRRFWPQTSVGDTNPHRVFRPRKTEQK